MAVFVFQGMTLSATKLQTFLGQSTVAQQCLAWEAKKNIVSHSEDVQGSRMYSWTWNLAGRRILALATKNALGLGLSVP